MATIRKRRLKAGGFSYTAQIRIKRNGEEVYQESKSFSSKKFDNPAALAKKWAQQREVELEASEPWEAGGVAGLTVGEALRRYVDEVGGTPKGIGKTKKSCMLLMAKESLICDAFLVDCDGSILMRYLRKRSELDKAAPATVLQDLIYFGVLCDYARVVWGLKLDLSYIADVRKMADSLHLVGKSEDRERRPEVDELSKILARYDVDPAGRGRSGRDLLPMQHLILFLLFSTRRLSEVTRIEWGDLDVANRRVLVRDMKHPRSKKGNHRWVHLPDRALAVIQLQHKVDERIFPFDARSISASFQRACRMSGIDVEDLRLHDLRHEGISHYFELGWDIPRVAMVSGHSSWDSLKRYTHLSQLECVDKYAGWEWLNRFGIA